EHCAAGYSLLPQGRKQAMPFIRPGCHVPKVRMDVDRRLTELLAGAIDDGLIPGRDHPRAAEPVGCARIDPGDRGQPRGPDTGANDGNKIEEAVRHMNRDGAAACEKAREAEQSLRCEEMRR